MLFLQTKFLQHKMKDRSCYLVYVIFTVDMLVQGMECGHKIFVSQTGFMSLPDAKEEKTLNSFNSFFTAGRYRIVFFPF